MAEQERDLFLKQQENTDSSYFLQTNQQRQDVRESIKKYTIDMEQNLKEIDTIFGVSASYASDNDTFEQFLSAKNTAYKSKAQSLFQETKTAQETLLQKYAAIQDGERGDKQKVLAFLTEAGMMEAKMIETATVATKAVQASVTAVSYTESMLQSHASKMNSLRSQAQSTFDAITKQILAIQTRGDDALQIESSQTTTEKKKQSVESMKLALEKAETAYATTVAEYTRSQQDYENRIKTKYTELLSLEKSLTVSELTLAEVKA